MTITSMNDEADDHESDDYEPPPTCWSGADQDAAYRLFVPNLPGDYQFLDHRGQESHSYFVGIAPRAGKAPLPPLWSYQIYATFADADLLDVARFTSDLCRDAMRNIEGFSFRVDAYAMPGAKPEEVMQHFDREKLSRLRSPLAIPDYPYCKNYLVYIDDKEWKTATVSTFSWISDISKAEVQEAIKVNTPSIPRSGEDGSLNRSGDGNLGDALGSLWPLRCEDDDYEEALWLGKDSWEGCIPYERNPELTYISSFNPNRGRLW